MITVGQARRGMASRVEVRCCQAGQGTVRDLCSAEMHEQIKSNPLTWSALRFIGYQETEDEGALELRNCDRCESTLAIHRRMP